MINPLWIYIAGICPSINQITMMIMFVGIAAIAAMILNDFCENREINFYACKYKLLGTIFIISSVINVLTPSEQTVYTMLIVSQLTPENIEAMRNFGVETVQQLGDAIANSINKVEVR